MGRYKGIIFDLDGTLLNTIEDLADSMNRVLESSNYPVFNYDQYKLKVGGGFRGLVTNSLPENTDSDIIDKLVKDFTDSYSKNYQVKTKPYKGITDLLLELNKRGIKLAVNSNKRDEYTKKLVDKHFSNIPFVKIYGEREKIAKKPDPKSALEIAAYMNLKAKDILYIGDSSVDILTAKNANMDSAGVIWGFRSREEFEKFGADYIIYDPREILDLVDRN